MLASATARATDQILQNAQDLTLSVFSAAALAKAIGKSSADSSKPRKTGNEASGSAARSDQPDKSGSVDPAYPLLTESVKAVLWKRLTKECIFALRELPFCRTPTFGLSASFTRFALGVDCWHNRYAMQFMRIPFRRGPFTVYWPRSMILSQTCRFWLRPRQMATLKLLPTHHVRSHLASSLVPTDTQASLSSQHLRQAIGMHEATTDSRGGIQHHCSGRA